MLPDAALRISFVVNGGLRLVVYWLCRVLRRAAGQPRRALDYQNIGLICMIWSRCRVSSGKRAQFYTRPASAEGSANPQLKLEQGFW